MLFLKIHSKNNLNSQIWPRALQINESIMNENVQDVGHPKDWQMGGCGMSVISATQKPHSSRKLYS